MQISSINVSGKVSMEICVAIMSHTGAIQIKPPNFLFFVASFASPKSNKKVFVARKVDGELRLNEMFDERP